MRPSFGRSRLAPIAALALSGLLMPNPTARTQAQSPSDDRPPLARYVPKDELIFLFEFEGVDAHAEAWRKTSAYKILNETPTGAMIEDLIGQLATKLPQVAGKVSGPEAVAVLKHLARSGFVLALGGNNQKGHPLYTLMAFRDAFKNKEVRPAFARALQGMSEAGSKPQNPVRAGHKVVLSRMNAAASYTWWIEETKKEDLIVVLPRVDSADFILETLDGKHPTAVEHPSRVELSGMEGGLAPVLKAFITPEGLRLIPGLNNLGLGKIARLDLRGGFQDDAISSVLRLTTPKPHAGLLSVLDGPTFDRSSMPAMPAGLTNYSAASVNVLETFDRIVAEFKSTNPMLEDGVKQASDALKAKTKLRLREDVLARFGPRIAWYVLPAKSGPPPTLAAPTALGMVLAMSGIDQIPKVAMVIDIDNPTAFGKVLDELMGYANREIKALTAGQPGAPGAATKGGGRGRGPASPSAEFRLMPGENKSYVMSVPPEFATQIPASVRPTIRVAGKQVILALSPEVARMAQEAKGPNTPPSELSAAFAALPASLRFLSVNDPRETLPAVLAALPGKLQVGINKALIEAKVPPLAASAPASATTPPSAPGGNVAAGGIQPGIMPGPGGRRRNGSGEPTAPGGAPAPGTPDAAKPSPGFASIILQVDPAKLPSAEAIRALLFPTMFVVEEDGDGFKATLRMAFPDFGDPSKSSVMDQIKNRGGQGSTPPGGPGSRDGFFDVPPDPNAATAGKPGDAAPARPGAPAAAPGGRSGANLPMRPD